MPIREITSLAIPKSLVPAVKSLHTIFFRFLPDVNVVMGGGSVLAARWNHRDSTDIDLFVSPAAMQALTAEKSLLYRAVREAIGEAGVDPFSGFLSGDIEGTPFSLAASEFIREDQGVSEQIADTYFRAATNEEILSGKIMGRLHRNSGQAVAAPIRDLYDIVVAAHRASGVVGYILSGITQKGRSVIAADLRRMPDNLQEVDQKPLMNPRYQVELKGLAKTVAAAIEAGNETLLPPVFPSKQESYAEPEP